jgi:RNA polymerase sigma-70 factor (ECF subfamily)
LESTVETLAPALLRFCLGIGGDRTLAEEASQDALAALVDRWRRLGPPESPPAFAFAVARRRLHRALFRRRLLHPLEALGNGHERKDAEADALRRIELGDVLSAIERLGLRDREALLLVTVGDCNGASAAGILGISEAAFKMRLHRARTRLNELLGDKP